MAESRYLKELYRTYFDRYQRFRAAADLLHGLGLPSGARVLDVGSFDNAFASFVPKLSVKAYDGVVHPDGGALPYRDGFFEVVMALDVLEHVRPGDRAYFIAEAARAARTACVFSFPIKAAEETERFVLQLTGNAWLAEHQEFGLPEPAEVEAVLAEAGLVWERRPNASLASWMSMHLLMHRLAEEPKTAISEFFNRNFCETENREPCYRYIYLCTKQG